MDKELGISYEDLESARRVLAALEQKHEALASYVSEKSEETNNPILVESASKLWDEAREVLGAGVVVEQYLDGYYRKERAA